MSSESVVTASRDETDAPAVPGPASGAPAVSGAPAAAAGAAAAGTSGAEAQDQGGAGIEAAIDGRPGAGGGSADGGSAADGGPAVDVTRLRVALARLSRRLRKHEIAGLTPTQLAALATVERSGPMRLGDLAAAEGIAPSTLTRLVTALEDSGYVRRFADPSDARASTLAITPHGHEMLERLRSETTAVLTQSLSLLTPAQRAALAAALPVLEQLAEPGLPG